MNRTVRHRSVAVLWSLFPRERWPGAFPIFFVERSCHEHGLWFVLPVPRGKGLIFQSYSISYGYIVCLVIPVLSRNIAVCSCRESWWRVSCIASMSVLEVTVSWFWWFDFGCCFLRPSFASWPPSYFPCTPVCACIHWNTAVLNISCHDKYYVAIYDL